MANALRLLSNPQDLAYAREQFRCVRYVDPELPAPAYWDGEGNAYVPYDYEFQERDQVRFISRASAEIARLGAAYDRIWIVERWNAYWGGIYSMCLKSATPENIVLKNVLIDRIEKMLATRSDDEEWRMLLMSAVDELDAIERPFCAFDRLYFGRRVTRDTYITEVRKALHPCRDFSSTPS